MANKFSTGLAIGINGNKGLKELMSDFVINYYGGTPATTTQALRDEGYSDADAVVTVNPLAIFTKGGATLTGTASTQQEANIIIVRGSTNDTITFLCATPSRTLVYTQTAADSTNDLLATSFAAALNADTTINKVIEAIAVVGTGVTESVVYLRAIFPGEPFVITSVTPSGTITSTLNPITANVRINSLHFGYPDAYGDVSNEVAYTWLATGLVADTATWFRVVKPDDNGTLSHTAPRIQGNIATAGAEINLQPSTSIVVGQPLSITSYKVNVKKSVA